MHQYCFRSALERPGAPQVFLRGTPGVPQGHPEIKLGTHGRHLCQGIQSGHILWYQNSLRNFDTKSTFIRLFYSSVSFKIYCLIIFIYVICITVVALKWFNTSVFFICIIKRQFNEKAIFNNDYIYKDFPSMNSIMDC